MPKNNMIYVELSLRGADDQPYDTYDYGDNFYPDSLSLWNCNSKKDPRLALSFKTHNDKKQSLLKRQLNLIHSAKNLISEIIEYEESALVEFGRWGIQFCSKDYFVKLDRNWNTINSCAQCCVAAVSGVPFHFVLRNFGCGRKNVKEVYEMLDTYRVKHQGLEVFNAANGYLEDKTAILKTERQADNNYHWLYIHEGEIFDPDTLSTVRRSEYFKSLNEGKTIEEKLNEYENYGLKIHKQIIITNYGESKYNRFYSK